MLLYVNEEDGCVDMYMSGAPFPMLKEFEESTATAGDALSVSTTLAWYDPEARVGRLYERDSIVLARLFDALNSSTLLFEYTSRVNEYGAIPFTALTVIIGAFGYVTDAEDRDSIASGPGVIVKFESEEAFVSCPAALESDTVAFR